MEASLISLYGPWVAGMIVLALGRAWLHRGARLEGLFKVLDVVEVSFLGLLLVTLIALGGLQIVLRNFFHGGVLWADPLMRHVVLWLGCLGAALATTRARHINIDVFTRMVPEKLKPLRRAVVYTATAVATFVLGIAAHRLVIDEREFGDIAFGSVPVWVLMLVLPVSFFLISYRSLVNLFIGKEPEAMEGEGLDDAVVNEEVAR